MVGVVAGGALVVGGVARVVGVVERVGSVVGDVADGLGVGDTTGDGDEEPLGAGT